MFRIHFQMKVIHLLICDGGEAFIVDSPADFCTMALCGDTGQTKQHILNKATFVSHIYQVLLYF